LSIYPDVLLSKESLNSIGSKSSIDVPSYLELSLITLSLKLSIEDLSYKSFSDLPIINSGAWYCHHSNGPPSACFHLEVFLSKFALFTRVEEYLSLLAS